MLAIGENRCSAKKSCHVRGVWNEDIGESAVPAPRSKPSSMKRPRTLSRFEDYSESIKRYIARRFDLMRPRRFIKVSAVVV
jgi:hypothetical protein